ncbi:hypothetical protein [Novosphingobium lentum]|uniref:hypothetical protein n=1 Tax=Novosphingobium lentum TaxID=145287 RepID=UPI0008336FF2|nr:hypothetical protein [Novosphingobium lentum]
MLKRAPCHVLVAGLISVSLAACDRTEPAASHEAANVAAAQPAAPTLPTATPTPAPAPIDPPARLTARGTAPDWSAKIDGGFLMYITRDFPQGTRIAVKRTATRDTVAYAGSIDGKPILLTLAAGPCSDGQEDKVWAYTATREIGPDVQRGCAGGG